MAGDRSKIKTNYAWMGPKRGGDTRAYTPLIKFIAELVFKKASNGRKLYKCGYYTRKYGMPGWDQNVEEIQGLTQP